MSTDVAAPASTHEDIINAIHTLTPRFPVQGNDEKNNDYYIRVIKKLTAVDDDAWEALTQQARDWCDAAAKKFRDTGGRGPLPAIPGYEEAKAAETEKAKRPQRIRLADIEEPLAAAAAPVDNGADVSPPEVASEVEAPGAPTVIEAVGTVQAAAEVPTPAAAAPSVEAPPADAAGEDKNTRGITQAFRQLVCENHETPLKTLRTQFMQDHPGMDVKEGTLNILYSNTRAVIKILEKLGKLK